MNERSQTGSIGVDGIPLEPRYSTRIRVPVCGTVANVAASVSHIVGLSGLPSGRALYRIAIALRHMWMVSLHGRPGRGTTEHISQAGFSRCSCHTGWIRHRYEFSCLDRSNGASEQPLAASVSELRGLLRTLGTTVSRVSRISTRQAR